MITLKQMEALCRVADLGTFERAANRLNMTQSAISKRIQELEATIGFEIFDRSQRTVRFTEKGETLLTLGREMLVIQDRMLALKGDGEIVARRLRIGLTELSTITWFPRFVSAIERRVPGVSVEPHVDTSRSLYERLLDEDFDLIVTPKCFADPSTTAVPVGEAVNVWLARPGLVPEGGTLSLDELSAFPVLMQGRRSGSGVTVNRWLTDKGAAFPRLILSDNLNTVFGLTVAGLGIGCLPLAFIQNFIDQGKLVRIAVDPELPPIPYVAMYKNDRMSSMTAAALEVVGETCCLSEPLSDLSV